MSTAESGPSQIVVDTFPPLISVGIKTIVYLVLWCVHTSTTSVKNNPTFPKWIFGLSRVLKGYDVVQEIHYGVYCT